MADLGWLGIHLPEAYGGAGAALSELIVVLEEFGRQVAPGPFLPTVVASALLAQCATPDLQAALLPGLADGSVTGALGLGGSLTLSDGLLDGPAGIVLGGASADLLLLRLGEDVVVVRPDSDGVTVRTSKDLDPSRRSAAVTLSSVRVVRRRRHRRGRPARSGPGAHLGRCGGGGHRVGLHRLGRGLRQGARAVRADHRHLSSGEAPLRRHAGCRRGGHRGRLGRRPGC